MKSTIHVFDDYVGNKVKRIPKQFRPLMIAFSWLGEPVITVGIASVVFGYGLALGKPLFIEAGAVAIITIAIGALLKLLLRRSRPVTEYVEKMFFKTFSFPSGHAIGSLISYGLAAFVLSLKWPEIGIYAWSVATILTLFVSLSRIYLGAHYASDIIGGWIVGIAGLFVILFRL